MSYVKEHNWIKTMLKGRSEYSGKVLLGDHNYEDRPLSNERMDCAKAVENFGRSLANYGHKDFYIGYYSEITYGDMCYMRYTARRKYPIGKSSKK